MEFVHGIEVEDSGKCPRQRSSSGEPSRPLKIVFHRFKVVVKRNTPARQEALKIQLWQPRKKRRPAQRQPLPLKQRQRKFSAQFSLS